MQTEIGISRAGSATIDHSSWRPSHNVWLIAFSVMLATFLEVLDTSVATVSLPHIAGSLSATRDESTWVLTSYLISNAIVLPISGWLSNMLGRKRYQLWSVTLFTLASMWCGAATSLGMLITARVLQGAAGGGLQPVSQAVLLESFPVEKRGQHGIGAILSMLIAGRLVGRVDERLLIVVGVVIRSVSLFMLGDLNLSMSMGTVIWPNIINGFANGFLFVPLTTITMKTLPNELMGAGTGLFNLLRNLGGSLGISLTTTLLTRGAQAHQNAMSANLTGSNPAYWNAMQRLSGFFTEQRGPGSASRMAMGAIYRNMLQQATLASYIDVFRLLAWLSLVCIPFIFFFRNTGARRNRAPVLEA